MDATWEHGETTKVSGWSGVECGESRVVMCAGESVCDTTDGSVERGCCECDALREEN